MGDKEEESGRKNYLPDGNVTVLALGLVCVVALLTLSK